jgi:hypothetical protein
MTYIIESRPLKQAGWALYYRQSGGGTTTFYEKAGIAYGYMCDAAKDAGRKGEFLFWRVRHVNGTRAVHALKPEHMRMWLEQEKAEAAGERLYLFDAKRRTKPEAV